MEDAYWTFSFDWARLLAGCALGAAVLWLSVVNLRRVRGGRRAAAAEAVRICAAALLVFTLLRPERVRRKTSDRRSVVAVLCDASGSMRTEDVVTTNRAVCSRAAWVAGMADVLFRQPLLERFGVALEDFDACSGGASNAAAEAGTDIHAALEGARKRHNNLRAVVLLSDGDWNTGPSPVAAATRLRMEGIPVYAVAVGSDRYLPDLELTGVSAPTYALVEEDVSLPFVVKSRIGREIKTTVTLEGPGEIEARRDVVIPAMGEVQETLILSPRGEGEFEFEVKLPVLDDEILADNNSKAFSMSVRRELLKVLVVEKGPRWEYRFLRNALSRDPGVDVDCLLFHPEGGPAAGRGYLPAFPAGREELSVYDVVFLGDVGIASGELANEEATLLRGLVEHQGSGLVFLPGRKGRQATLSGTPLEEIMPVILDGKNPRGISAIVPSPLVLTSRGRSHLLTLLAPTPAENHAVWNGLPGNYWHAGVLKARAGSTVLAVHSTARNSFGRVPLIVTRPCGNGKVLFMGTDSAWRWRRGVEDVYHYRFWGQVVRWMAHQRHMAHRAGIRMFHSPESPVQGSRVFLHATVMDQAGFPVDGGTVKAVVSSPGGGSQEIIFSPDEAGWGVYTAGFTPGEGGDYHVVVGCSEVGREIEAYIPVAGLTRERVGRPARADVLKEICALTGGECGSTGEAAALVEKIRVLPASSPHEERLRLWCHPLWAGLIVAVLGVHWVWRKLLGLL